MLRNRYSRRRRAIALVSTVLLMTMAVAVALVIANQALSATRNEARRIDALEARTRAVEALEKVKINLAVDPLYFYSVVGTDERARVCTQGDNRVVEPGEPWPQECSTTWGYQTASSPSDARVEITPPGVQDPRLKVRVLARSTDGEAGIDAWFVPDSTDRFSLASVADLDLTALPGSLEGEVATSGELKFPPEAVNLTATANSFSPDPATVGAGSDPTNLFSSLENGPPAARLSAAQLRSSYPALHDLACPSTPALVKDSLATSLCITPGASLLARDGTSFSVPFTTRAVLLVFASQDPTVDVYVSDKVSGAPVACVGDPCDLAADSASSLTAGTHPGSFSFWTRVGTAALPVSGLVFSSLDTTLSLCEAFTGTSACAPLTATRSESGMVVPASTTILVGTTIAPATATISGPITLADGASFGVVATKQVVVPYHAHPLGGNLELSGSFLALGMNASGASITTIPATATAPTKGGSLVVKGSMSGISLDVSFSIFDEVSFAPGSWTNPPPLFPAPQGTWRMTGQRTVAPGEICGARLCPSF